MTQKVDVLVIGGGSIGLHAAYYLLKSGRSVTLVDQSRVGEGSSAGNAGHIVPSHIVPLAAPGVISDALRWLLDPKKSPFGMKLSLDPAYLWWLIRFAAACSETNVERGIPALKDLGLLSAHHFAEIIASEGIECGYLENGLLFLYQTRPAFEAGIREAETLHRHQMPAEILDREAVHLREPLAKPEVIGGIHYTGDASLHPGEYLRQLADLVDRMGADLIEGSPVTGFENRGDQIRRVITPNEDFEPNLVVLAAGAWSPGLGRRLGLVLPIQPARGYSLTSPASHSMPRQALLLGERKVAVTPMGDVLRFTGRLEIGNMSMVPEPRWISAIESAVREYIEIDPELDIRETWAGLRPTTPDGLPIIDFSPRHRNLIIAAGHAMLGLSLGPGTGHIVADMANGSEPALKTDRFRLR